MMTVKQLYDACKENRFIIAREKSGHLSAINCKVAEIIFKRKKYKDDANTAFVGFAPCSFQEYITYKIPFK